MMRYTVENHPDRPTWLEARQASIGGSDIVNLVNVPVDGRELRGAWWLWVQKNPAAWESLGEEGQANFAELEKRYFSSLNREARMAMEPVIQGWAQERDGITIVDPGDFCIFRQADAPRRHCSPDGLVLNEGIVGREWHPNHLDTEASYKTVNPFMRREWEKGPSDYAILQAHWTMLVTGWDHVRLYAQVGYGDSERDRLAYIVERNDRLVAELARVEEEFWRHVDEDIPPPLDGFAGTTDILRLLNPVPKERVSVALPEDIFGQVHEELVKIRERKKELAAEEHLAKQLIEAELAEKGATDGVLELEDAIVTYRRQEVTVGPKCCPKCDHQIKGGYTFTKLQPTRRKKK